MTILITHMRDANGEVTANSSRWSTSFRLPPLKDVVDPGNAI